MINKSKADSSSYSIRNSMLLQLQIRKNSDLVPKYQKLKERQSIKVKEFLKLIDRGEKSIQTKKTKQDILEKIDLSLVQLQKTPKASLKVVYQKNNNPIYKRHKKQSTEEPQEGKESVRIKQLKQKMNVNQFSIKFPQLALVKETLIIQESLITEKKSRERQKLKSVSNRKQAKQGTNLANIHLKACKKQEKPVKHSKSSYMTIDQQPYNSSITQWTVAKWD